MSATLGEAGELERSFGVSKIKRIPLPRGWERQGSGRRLPLFPALSGEPDVLGAIHSALDSAKHNLVIVPTNRDVDEAIDNFVPGGMPVVKRDEVEYGFAAFTNQERAALVLANRYDGMDPPDDACRLVLLYRLPLGAHLQERFLLETLGAREALDERIRTRITQGMGRATRNRQDFAAVLVAGQDLISFLSREDVRRSMRPELQAELELGFHYADNEIPIEEALEAFFEQGEDWREAEEHLRQEAEKLESLPMPGASELAASVASEVMAWRHAWGEDFVVARDHARQAAAELTSDSVKHYRALWRYLAASWGQLVAERGCDESDARLATELRRDAEVAFKVLRWFPRFEGEVDVPVFGPEYSWRAERAAEWIDRLRRGSRLRKELDAMVGCLGSGEFKEFEIGLETLGSCLGFESVRPNQSADPDCAWREGDKAWIVWEAKTMENPDKPLAPRDVRQACTHRNWVSSQLSWVDPKRSATIVICRRKEVESDAAAICDDDVFLIAPEVVRDIGGRASETLATAAAEAPGLSVDQLKDRVAKLFAEHGLGTDQLLETLTSDPIAARG